MSSPVLAPRKPEESIQSHVADNIQRIWENWGDYQISTADRAVQREVAQARELIEAGTDGRKLNA